MDTIDQTPESLIALHELIERLELTDEQRERWRRVQGDAADVLMDAFAAAALSLARPATFEAMAPPPPPPPANVDVGEKDAKKRIAAAWKVISAAVEALDTSSDVTARFNAKVYLLRLGWHESADYTTREQGGGGPARGLFQAQRGAAVDALDFALTKRPEQFDVMAAYAGTDRAGLKKALDALAKATGDALPAGNLVAEVLRC